MKTCNTILCVILLLFSMGVSAQKMPDYVPEHGFWMIVSNKHQKREATVQFYNDEKQLIYEERITGKRIRAGRKKTLRCLKQGLEKALIAYNQEQEMLIGKDWVATLLKK